MKIKTNLSAVIVLTSGLVTQTNGFQVVTIQNVNRQWGNHGKKESLCDTTQTCIRRIFSSSSPSSLFGLLDEMMSGTTDEEVSEEDTSSNNSPINEEFESLFHTLVFSSGDTKALIEKKLDECTNPEFLQYLQTLLECSKDAEESQALQELLDIISTVKQSVEEQTKKEQLENEAQMAAAKEKQEMMETEQQQSQEEETDKVSATDLLRRANEIDRAVSSAAASDEGKPSDFISDCREVVNLSSGFNNRGQMRVGGR